MKLIGRLLLVTALLTTVTAFIGSGGVGAATDTVAYEPFRCGFSLNGNPFPAELIDPTVGLEIGLSAPDTVAPGASAAYTVTVGGDPGIMNAGYSRFDNGRAKANLLVNGVPVTTEAVVIPDTAKNAPIVIPDIPGVVAGVDAVTTIEVESLRYYTLNAQGAVVANSQCNFAEGNRAGVTVALESPTSTTSSTSTSTTSTTSSTSTSTTSTTSTSTTSTTAAPTSTTSSTSTTVPGGSATIETVTRSATYSCDVVYEGGASIPDQQSPVEITISAPDKATAGTKFQVYMDVLPGIGNGPVVLPAGSISSFVTAIEVGAGGSPSVAEQSNPTNSEEVGSFGHIPVPRQESEITASGAVGDEISFTPGSIVVTTKAVPEAGLPNPGTVSCTIATDTFLSTEIVEEDLTPPVDPPPPAPTPSTTTTAPPPAASSTPTTAVAPVTANASSGPQAQVIEKSAQVTYECKIYSGSNLITTQQDTQTVTVKTVDKVAPGGTLSFQMSLAPGPKTGPVALPNGVENMTVGAAAGGPASPAQISMSAGNLTAPVGTDANIQVPTVSGSTQVTGSEGQSITLTASDMRFETARPPSRTECAAVNPPPITTTQIVEGVEVAAETAEQLASTGNGRGWLLPLAISQLAVGLGLVLMQHRRRRMA